MREAIPIYGETHRCETCGEWANYIYKHGNHETFLCKKCCLQRSKEDILQEILGEADYLLTTQRVRLTQELIASGMIFTRDEIVDLIQEIVGSILFRLFRMSEVELKPEERREINQVIEENIPET